MMNKHEKIPRRKRKSFYTNSYSKIRVKEDLIADKLQVSYWGSRISFFVDSVQRLNFRRKSTRTLLYDIDKTKSNYLEINLG